ncbi:glycosyltransferase family 4 protein [Butyrivibrio fibrisolvens]|uniref:glycosyltransferase family 4 protein n=1 Tax=Butyrivibrio fibrisolvens TaxID=831 RepID=UPI00040A6BD0|nr:glycosyltransferase family 4 protein [Butyrivibrio fibrisolvens]
MKIGILYTFPQKMDFFDKYNVQTIGMAKGLINLGIEIEIYHVIPYGEEYTTKEIVFSNGSFIIHFIPTIALRSHGLVNTKYLNKKIDSLVFFSDLQLCVPYIEKWARKNHIGFIPYIGVCSSNSMKKFWSIVSNLFMKRNYAIYKKYLCLAKTPEVLKELSSFGVNSIQLAPVGLDLNLLKADHDAYDIGALKKESGFEQSDHIIIFVGRLVDEKRPLDMIEIFSSIISAGLNYKLLIIGNGELANKVKKIIEEYHLKEHVKIISSIDYSDMWKVYKISDVFINLNKQEIFGMAVLEALYYGCRVIAFEAPGPSYIIENGISGDIIKDDSEIIELLRKERNYKVAGKERVVGKFTWDQTAKIIKRVAEEIGEPM